MGRFCEKVYTETGQRVKRHVAQNLRFGRVTIDAGERDRCDERQDMWCALGCIGSRFADTYAP
jgi:hypothetical protein